MSLILTEKVIRGKIKEVGSNGKKKTLSDKRNKNLVVEIRPTGTATYFYRYRDSDLKTKHVKLGKFEEINLKDARRAAQRQAAKIINGEDPQGEKEIKRSCPTLDEFFNEVYLPYSKANKKSFKTDENLVGKHIIPSIGNRKLTNISKKDIDKLLDGLTRKNLSPATRKRIIAVLSHMFTIAIDKEIPGISENPTKRVKKPTIDNNRAYFLTSEEIQLLLEAAKNHQHPNLYGILKMLILTGSRRGEVLQAKFSDFDLVNKVWNIPEGKTGSRKVIISDAVVDFVKGLPKYESTDLLFPKPHSDEPYKCINDPFKRVLKKAGLSEKIRVHDLRHTHASMAIQNGASLPEVQRILGHSNITTTTRYIHLLDDSLRCHGNKIAHQINV